MQLPRSAFCMCLAVVTPTAFAGIDRAIYINPVPNSPLTTVVQVEQTGTATRFTSSLSRRLPGKATDACTVMPGALTRLVNQFL
jgi:hypothetical protein